MTEEEKHSQLLQLKEEITAFVPFDKFIRVQTRLAELRLEEDQKLELLAELQKVYLSANSDLEKDKVKEMVGKIRELSKVARSEIRSLNSKIQEHMPVEKARHLYKRLLELQENPSGS
jgi:hypothetical protein